MTEQRLIDADALMERLNMHCYIVQYDHGSTSRDSGMTLSGIRQVIDELPTIEPKKGKWIVKEGTVCFHDVCSECGKRFVHTYPHYNFCPNCGARMVQEGEEP